MTPATAWRWCAAAGVVAFLCSLAFGWIPGLAPCGPTGGVGPIIAFEFVRSPAEVAALFGVEPCRSTFVGAQQIGLVVDAIGFIPAYVAFLVLATMASARITDRRPAFATVVAAMFVLGGLADEIEGGLLYLILSDLPGTQPVIDALWWAVHVKFVLLMLGTLGIAVLLLAGRSIGGMVASLPITLGAATALVTLRDMPTPVVMTGFTISWTAILICAIAASVRSSLFSARGAPPPAPGSPSA